MSLNLLAFVKKGSLFPLKRNLLLFDGVIVHTRREPSVRRLVSALTPLPAAATLPGNLLTSFVQQGTNVGHLSCIKRHGKVISRRYELNRE